MDLNQKLLSLEQLKDSKLKEYEKALERFSTKNQAAITFGEVCGLKEEVDELNSLIAVIKKMCVA